MSKNEDTIYQSAWDAAKSAPKEKCIAVNEFMKKERSQINNLTSHLKTLEEEQTNLKQAKRRK